LPSIESDIRPVKKAKIEVMWRFEKGQFSQLLTLYCRNMSLPARYAGINIKDFMKIWRGMD
jgi:hypothetical protein